MKEKYITVTGMKYYYGLLPFKIGKKLKCVKEPDNPYESEGNQGHDEAYREWKRPLAYARR